LRRRGVLARGENALESLAQCTHLVFDKTGTLTTGTLRVHSVRLLGELDREQVLTLCSALQQHSSHPIASAFDDVLPAALDSAELHVGAGVAGRDSRFRYRMGSAAFCSEMTPGLAQQPTEDLVWVALVREDAPLAWIGLQDTTRPEAREIVGHAQACGLQVELLTGDHSPRGPALARTLGMDAERHGQTPEDKLRHVHALQDAGAVVCMVGDGVNDGPVLGGADTSFAVAGSSDLARSQADFVVLDGNLGRIEETLRVARRCRVIIRQNFAWALLYNISAIPLAAAGFVPPWVAALGMSLSSLLVVGNSLRLRR
ncbi:MAG: HAD-IC family P-type ATPase, partial [Halioglobus sp.]|nr:HAD-IC family P-type ATPase [Halioglobus sp.]